MLPNAGFVSRNNINRDQYADIQAAFRAWHQHERKRPPVAPSNARHVCSSECEFFAYKNIYICRYGMLHVCDEDLCDRLKLNSQYSVCELTSRMYDLPFDERPCDSTDFGGKRHTAADEGVIEDWSAEMEEQNDDTAMAVAQESESSSSSSEKMGAFKKIMRRRLQEARRVDQLERLERREMTVGPRIPKTLTAVTGDHRKQ